MVTLVELAERMEFLELSQQHRDALKAFLPALLAELPSVLDGFYRKIRTNPSLAKMFSSDAAMKKAASAQAAHWELLFSGRFDGSYLDAAQKVGLIHSKIGLEPRWYMGGYAVVMRKLSAIAVKSHIHRWSRDVGAASLTTLLEALNLAITLDMELGISIYLDENKRLADDRIAKIALEFEGSVGRLISLVTAGCSTLQSTAHSMSQTAIETKEQATKVTSAAGEASTGLHTVAAAAEELTASISEISRQVSQSAAVTAKAVDDSRRTDEAVKKLADGATKIGQIVELIGGIAAQTNLLALNATIEAARAGDAGKGFAVVASEVKNLAQQTAKSTGEIGNQVHQIQESMNDVVQAIKEIGSTIGEVSMIATTIASAVEEQTAATGEIARNVNQTAEASTNVTLNISKVSAGADSTENSAKVVLESAHELSGQAAQLSQQVNVFLAKMKAA
jgi:methyl-accepting chemotaxis protein